MTHPIFVTGPQRSGTRIASHMIALQTKRKFIDELDYNINIPTYSVVQAPFLLKSVLELSFIFPSAKFAFMLRNKQDIIKSMERIEWCKDYIDHPDFYKTYVDDCYNYIDCVTQSLDKDRWFTIDYQSLSTNPLFVTDRSNFTTKQHLPNIPNGPKTWRSNEEHT